MELFYLENLIEAHTMTCIGEKGDFRVDNTKLSSSRIYHQKLADLIVHSTLKSRLEFMLRLDTKEASPQHSEESSSNMQLSLVSNKSRTVSGQSCVLEETKRSDSRRQQEFVRCLQKMIKSARIADKHLDNVQKSNREYHVFDKQEAKLSSIRQTIETLDRALQKSLLQKQRILESCERQDLATCGTATVIGNLIDYLIKLQKRIEAKYKIKEKTYADNKQRLSQFTSDVDALGAWLDSTQSQLIKFNESNSSTKQSLNELLQVSFVIFMFEELITQSNFVHCDTKF